jgi:hypothetical protein
MRESDGQQSHAKVTDSWQQQSVLNFPLVELGAASRTLFDSRNIVATFLTQKLRQKCDSRKGIFNYATALIYDCIRCSSRSTRLNAATRSKHSHRWRAEDGISLSDVVLIRIVALLWTFEIMTIKLCFVVASVIDITSEVSICCYYVFMRSMA